MSEQPKGPRVQKRRTQQEELEVNDFLRNSSHDREDADGGASRKGSAESDVSTTTEKVKKQDNLSVSSNKHLMRMFATLKEDLLLSEAVVKINRKGKNQLRMLVITTGAVYNFKTKSARKARRRIELGQVTKVILVSETTDEFIIQTKDEYDYQIKTESREAIVQMLRAAVYNAEKLPLAVISLSLELIETMKMEKNEMSHEQKSMMATKQSVFMMRASTMGHGRSTLSFMSSIIPHSGAHGHHHGHETDSHSDDDEAVRLHG